MPFRFDNQYARLPAQFYERVAPMPVRQPSWIAFNAELGALLNIGPDEQRSVALLDALAGNLLPAGADPIALAYAGHQFGGFVPRLGDGRAVLLGEALGLDNVRRDVQLKGSGPTPFSRGGDGRAALGPVLREFLVSEAMYALGVSTTRALAAVRTGELVYRESVLPGAVLTRIASSHLRVGTFEYFLARRDPSSLSMLVQLALARHYPERQGTNHPALALLDAVIQAQAELVARWMAIGFVHGVMNTDNFSISGETLDYGPCAFLDAYEPSRTFSSIDHQGRYAFANQPRIALWNLARLAEALLPLFDTPDAEAVESMERQLGTFAPRFEHAYLSQLRRKLGISEAKPQDAELVRELLDLMAQSRADYTQTFRALTLLAGGGADTFSSQFISQQAVSGWLARWRARCAEEPCSAIDRAARMREANPAFIPRNHRVEEAIEAALRDDMGPFERLRRVLANPYDDQPDYAELTAPPGEEQWQYRTFCGT